MDLANVVILAVVQGLTEYLPISSTAHLLVLQKLLNTQPSVLFTIVLQLGTIFASIVYFRKKILSVIKHSAANVKSGNIKNDFGVWILIGIIPVIIVGFVASNYLDQIYNNPIIIVITSIAFGFMFYGIEVFYKSSKTHLQQQDLKLINIVKIGLMQILSLIPGVSRSGATISGGLAQKIDFKESIEISFLMSIPVMLAAGVYELLNHIGSFTPELLTQLLIGVIIAYFAGLVSIKLTLGFLLRRGFLPFLIYRVLFGLFVLIVVA